MVKAGIYKDVTFYVDGLPQRTYKMSEVGGYSEEEVEKYFERGAWIVLDTSIVYYIHGIKVGYWHEKDGLVLEDWFKEIIDFIPENYPVDVEQRTSPTTIKNLDSITVRALKINL